MSYQLELDIEHSSERVCGFTQEAYSIAQKVIEFRDTDALIYIALRQYGDFNDEIDHAYWTEIRRACKYIQACRAYWSEGHHWRLPMYD